MESLLDQLRHDPHTKIVEGKKDKKALHKLKITNIVTCSQSPQKAARLATDPAIILTDYDRKGRKLASRMIELLHGEGKSANMEYRRLIRKHTKINRMEELTKTIEKGE